MPRQQTKKNLPKNKSVKKSPGSVIGYCVKCKAKQPINGAKKVQTKRKNKFAMTGTCPKCGTKMFRFV
jgi:hypothetical protein